MKKLITAVVIVVAAAAAWYGYTTWMAPAEVEAAAA